MPNGLQFVLILPDGSKSLIPADWTDFKTPADPPQASPLVGSLDDLLRLRSLADALLRRYDDLPVRSGASQEGHAATESELHRHSRGPFAIRQRHNLYTDPLYVFTTNYDPLPDQLFKEWSARPFPSGRKLRACDGFSRDHPRRWQPQLFFVGPEDGERLIHMVKLHGSATWKLDTTGPIETGWGMPTPHDCLLYFGYKSVPETEPFITFHTLLKTALVQSDSVVAIGFRFADPYIRELFDFALRANSQLRLVCCRRRFPEPDSPLSVMMNRFPGRVLMLADTTGNCIPFGHADFAILLEQTLADMRQADAVA